MNAATGVDWHQFPIESTRGIFLDGRDNAYSEAFVQITERNGDYMRITPLFDAMQFTASGPNSLWIMGVGRLLLADFSCLVVAFQRLLLRKLTFKLDENRR